MSNFLSMGAGDTSRSGISCSCSSIARLMARWSPCPNRPSTQAWGSSAWRRFSRGIFRITIQTCCGPSSSARPSWSEW